jgi:hypothetical protein
MHRLSSIAYLLVPFFIAVNYVTLVTFVSNKKVTKLRIPSTSILSNFFCAYM